LARIPDAGGDIALLVPVIVEIINGHDPAVRPLHRARITEVPRAAVIPQNDLVAPMPAVVARKLRTNPIRRRAISVGQTEPAVLEADHARRVAHRTARRLDRPV